MPSNLTPLQPHSLRPAVWVALGVIVAGTAAGVFVYNRSHVAPEASQGPQAAAQPAPAATPALQQPSFDIVRVNPNGDAVMAGRAAPGAKVIIADGGKEIGEAQADQSGDWVFIPHTPMTPGARSLTLTERMPDGAEAKSDRSVVLVVPEPAAKAAPSEPALAVLTGPNVPPSILTGPAPADAAAKASGLTLGAVEYGEHARLHVAGTAAAGAEVRVYLDDKLVGQAAAGPDGKWALSTNGAVAPGEHHVRVDQLTANGTVTARIEQSFSRDQLELAAGKITIAPGENLWTIARHTYGHGIRYLVIFQANRRAIRDPSLIYPGQVFTLPPTGAAAATPDSSSTSR